MMIMVVMTIRMRKRLTQGCFEHDRYAALPVLANFVLCLRNFRRDDDATS